MTILLDALDLRLSIRLASDSFLASVRLSLIVGRGKSERAEMSEKLHQIQSSLPPTTPTTDLRMMDRQGGHE